MLDHDSMNGTVMADNMRDIAIKALKNSLLAQGGE